MLDIDLYNQELAAEEADSANIIAIRQQTDAFFKITEFDSSPDPLPEPIGAESRRSES